MVNVEIFAKYIPNFLLILLRASVFMALLPFLSSKSFPAQFKIGFALVIALVLTPIVEFKIEEDNIPLLIAKEVLLAMTLGITVRSVFMAVDIAGQAMSNALGMSIATVFNPEIGQSTEIARLYGIFATLLFFAMDAHHDRIDMFVKSYGLLPAGQVNIKNLLANVISNSGRAFVIALKVGAPVLVGLVITNLLLGFIYKAAPQINIFFVSFPVYIVIGFLIMLLSIPVLVYVLGGYFGEMKDGMLRIMALASDKK